MLANSASHEFSRISTSPSNKLRHENIKKFIVCQWGGEILSQRLEGAHEKFFVDAWCQNVQFFLRM